MADLRPRDINLFIGKLYEQVKRVAIKGETKKSTVDTKNIILFVDKIYGHMIDAVRDFEKEHNEKFRIAFLYDSKHKIDDISKTHLDKIDIKISCDTNSQTAVQKALLPYTNDIFVVTCRPESGIPLFSRVLANVPYVKGPTSESLKWATDKIEMRKRLEAFDATITPAFKVITDEKKSVKDVIEHVGFPLVVKPSGLAASRLVSICFHEEELKEVLKKVFKKMNSVHKETSGTFEPRVLVEHFMEGEMYSVDAYVDGSGKIYFCPIVHVKTGKRIGFDDFFGYQQMTPTQLKRESIKEAELVAGKAIYAMALRNTTVHVEVMRTEHGWKIIEMGPRMGGFRHMMYEHSLGMNHVMNDVMIRAGKKPTIPKKTLGYTAAMKFFAKEEGRLKAMNGIKKAQDLKSCKRMYINKKVGDMCTFAKHGGSSVFDIILFNKDRADLLADIRRLEKMIEFEIE